MYCNNCGSQINDDAVVCPYCGVQVQALKTEPKPADVTTETPVAQPQAQPAPSALVSNGSAQSNTVGIVGFVLAFFIPLAGLICSIIGLKKANQGAPYKGLAIAGVIISAIAMFFNLILVVSCTCAAIAAGAAAGATGPNVDYYYAVLSLL